MDRLIEEMKNLAGTYHAKRLSLFGSRARGDHRPDSDYDFALWGVPADCQSRLLSAADELPASVNLTWFLWMAIHRPRFWPASKRME